MARIKDPSELVPLRYAAALCGCGTDSELIPDLVRMRLIDDVIVTRHGMRYLRYQDLDYVRAWVLWWQERPRRPRRKRPNDRNR